MSSAAVSFIIINTDFGTAQFREGAFVEFCMDTFERGICPGMPADEVQALCDAWLIYKHRNCNLPKPILQ